MHEQVGRCVNAYLLKGAENIAQGNVIGELACKEITMAIYIYGATVHAIFKNL